MSETLLAVTGMTCAGCAQHVEQALRGVAGLRTVRVEYPESIARIDSDSPLAIDVLNAALPKSYRVKSLPAEDARGKATPASSLLGKALGTLSGSRRARAGAETPLHVAVIGTGGGAMAAAITAAERGAQVTDRKSVV